jgi:hypothetical protein
MREFCKRSVIIGTLVIWLVKFIIRPFVPLDNSALFVLGFTPNLIASYLIPFGAYWLFSHPLFFNGVLLRFRFLSNLSLVCLWGFALAIVNECLQLIPVFGRTFDFFDILFSFVGLCISFYTFSALERKFSVS